MCARCALTLNPRTHAPISPSHPQPQLLRERAIAVNSLLVSTATRVRTDCVKQAVKEVLVFRKTQK